MFYGSGRKALRFWTSAPEKMQLAKMASQLAGSKDPKRSNACLFKVHFVFINIKDLISSINV